MLSPKQLQVLWFAELVRVSCRWHAEGGTLTIFP